MQADDPMKVWYFNILFAGAVTAATLLFQERAERAPNEIDELSSGLAGARAFITGESAITFDSYEKPVEHLIWSRYIFFPARIERIQDVQHDTTLMVMSKNATDSSISSMVRERKLLWLNKDDKYTYLLLTNGKN